MTDQELMQMALDALEEIPFMSNRDDYENVSRVITTLRARLAQSEPEPVAWADKYDVEREGHDFYANRQQPAKNGVPLYTAPPQREWQGLTDEEMMMIYGQNHEGKKYSLGRAIEAKLKEKNT